jgi:hypothetical protein
LTILPIFASILGRKGLSLCQYRQAERNRATMNWHFVTRDARAET